MQHQQQWTIRNQHQRRRLLFVMKCIAVIYCIIRMGIQYRQHDDYHDSPTTMMSMTNRLEDDGPIEASMTFQQNIPCSSFTRSWLLSVADAFGATPSGAVVETPFQRRRHCTLRTDLFFGAARGECHYCSSNKVIKIVLRHRSSFVDLPSMEKRRKRRRLHPFMLGRRCRRRAAMVE